jgi:hypothetical protein
MELTLNGNNISKPEYQIYLPTAIGQFAYPTHCTTVSVPQLAFHGPILLLCSSTSWHGYLPTVVFGRGDPTPLSNMCTISKMAALCTNVARRPRDVKVEGCVCRLEEETSEWGYRSGGRCCIV